MAVFSQFSMLNSLGASWWVWVPQIGSMASGVWVGNLLVWSQRLYPIGHSTQNIISISVYCYRLLCVIGYDYKLISVAVDEI